jgi:hypothetical protein
MCVCVFMFVCGSHLFLKQLTSFWETLYEFYATGNHPSAIHPTTSNKMADYEIKEMLVTLPLGS